MIWQIFLFFSAILEFYFHLRSFNIYIIKYFSKIQFFLIVDNLFIVNILFISELIVQIIRCLNHYSGF